MVKWHKVISTVVAVVFAMSGNLVMTVATAAPVATVKLSSLQQIEEKLDNGLALSIAMANLSNDEAKLVLAQQRSGAKLFGTITYGANNEPLTDTSTQMHSYNKLSFTGGLVLPLLGSKNKDLSRFGLVPFMPMFLFAAKINTLLAVFWEWIGKGHQDSSMAPWWVLRKNKF